tara:strand:- start:45 stop:215 length:171 start_codon:yes stop_codon:yes gene_type:complete
MSSKFKEKDKINKELVLHTIATMAHLWTENYCRDVVKQLNLTGSAAKVKYEECLRW